MWWMVISFLLGTAFGFCINQAWRIYLVREHKWEFMRQRMRGL